MKQKFLVLAILLTGIAITAKAQVSKEEKSKLEKVERARVAARVGARAAADVEPYVLSTTGQGVYVMGDNEKRVSLNLSKNFSGETVTSDAYFEVSKGQTSISLHMSGRCDDGKITIKILLPGGDVFETLEITPAADINWSARFPIEEENEKQYVGKWKLIVETKNAEGSYNFGISSR